MALTGILGADFSAFQTAVAQTTTQLRSFQTGAAAVEKSLTRMADSFSGRKILQEAALAAKAVKDLGGVSTLTASEQARLNATLTEAIAKYRALGQQAPKEMQDLANATKNAAAATQGIGATVKGVLGSVSGLAGAFGVAFSVGAVVNFGKELLNTADHIQKVHDRTGLTTKEVQQFSYAAEQSGNTLDDLTSAISQMQNRLVSGDKSAIQAVKELGLNLRALTVASPGEQMRMIATALAAIQDPATRAAIAMDVFGKSGAEILPTLTSDFNKLADAAPAMSDATVKALDRAGDAFTGFWTSIKVGAAEGINHLVDLGSELEKLAFRFAGMSPPVKAFDISTAMLSEHQSTLHEVLHKTAEELAKEAKAAADAAAAHKIYADALAEIGKSMVALNPIQEQAVRLLHEHGINADVTAKSLKLTTEQVSRYLKSLEDAKDVMADVQSVADKMDTALNQIWDTEQLAAFRQELDSIAGAFDDAAVEAGRMGEEIDSALSIGANAKGAHDIGATITQSLFKDFGPTLQRALEGGGNVLQSIGSKLGGNLTQHIFGSKTMQASISSIFGKTLGGAFNDLLPGIGAIAGPLISKIAGLFAGIGGPSKAEKAGRSATDQFAAQLASTLTWQQQIEVHQAIAAGASEKWANEIVGVRDAYLKAGHSVEEAQDAVNRLWAAEKQGGTAAQAIIDEIITKTHDLAAANDAAAKSAEELATATDQFSGKDLLHHADLAVQAVQAIGGITHLTQKETEQLNSQLQEALAKYAAMGIAAPPGMAELAKQTQAVVDATQKATKAVDDLTASQAKNFQGLKGYGNKPITQADIDKFLRENPGDIGRLRAAFSNITAGGGISGRMHDGGVVDMASWKRAHAGLAIDEVPIIAQTGEGVLSRGGMRTIGGASALASLNRGTLSGVGGHVIVHMGAGSIVINGTGKNAEQIAEELITVFRRNYAGTRSQMESMFGKRSA